MRIQSLSNMLSLTHKSAEVSFNDQKLNILHDLIKNNENNKDAYLFNVKDFFFSQQPLPQLPQFRKKQNISYLNPEKDLSKTKKKIMKNIKDKRDALRQVIIEIVKK